MAIFLIITATCAAFFTQSLQNNDSYASILSGIGTVVTVYLAVVDHLRRQDNAPPVDEAAEDLRLRLLGHWRPELHRRVLFGPHDRTIPLEWRKYGGSGARSPLDGRFEGDPDQAAKRLAERFDQPDAKKRMVVLGEPGSGKTFVAISLVVGLLDRWTGDQPIAVYLPLSSWDPLTDGLDDWIVRTIADEHYSGDERTPRKLLTARRLVPVIDGLDELPEHLRRLAVRRINQTLTGDRMLVVTCRTAEYEDVLTGGAPELLRAPAVEVLPVTRKDLLARLREVPAWADVASHVASRPDGPVAKALSTPLMLSLFSSVYLERDTADLLDETKLGNKHAVEDHIIDLRLDTAYPDEKSSGQWTSEKAKRWLGFLARQMHQYDERDITWRKLAFRAGMTAAPLITVVAVAVIGLIWLAATLPSVNVVSSSVGVNAVTLLTSFTPLTAVLVGTLGAATWLAFRRERKAQTHPEQHRRRVRGFNRGLLTGFATTVIAGIVLILAPVESITDSFVNVVYTSAVVCSTLALAVVCGAGVGMHEMLVEHSAAKRAQDELRREKVSTVVAACASGLLIGALSVGTAIITVEVGAYLGQRFARSFGLDTVTDLKMPPLASYMDWQLTRPVVTMLAVSSVLVAVLCGLTLAATRAWPRLISTRVRLALSGHLPWRLRQFISDATRRGLLRQAGAAHQFGHVLLQERLVAIASDDTLTRQRPWPRIIVVGMCAMFVIALSAAAWSGAPTDCSPTHKAGIDERMARVTTEQASGCFSLVTEPEWEEALQRTPADRKVLAEIKAQQTNKPWRDGRSIGDVSVFVDFRRPSPAEWHDVLVGITTAQQVSKGSLRITFIFADLEGNLDLESARLLNMYHARSIESGAFRQPGNRRRVAVDLQMGSSQYVDWQYGSMHVVAAKDDKFPTRVREQSDRAALSWQRSPEQRSVLKGPPADALVDKIDGDLCPDLAAALNHSLGFDLRAAQLTPAVLDKIAACEGGGSVLVKPEDVEWLTSLPNRPSAARIHYVNDLSSSIPADCTRVLGPKLSTESLKTCIAVVAANESYRVFVDQLPQPEPR